jgi:hypothetical protein
MRTKVTLILLLLNVALFFFIFRFEGDWRTERAALEVRRRVLGAEAADIRELTVTGPGGSFSLERRGDTWFLTRPLEWPANPHAVGRIINSLQFLEQSASFSVGDLEKNGQSLADYGLDQPKLVVSFTSGGADTTGTAPVTTTLRLGDITKVGDRLYLLSSDGRRVHVVGRELADALSLRVDQVRADTLLTIPVFEARSLNLQVAGPGGVRVRIRRDGDRWLFETPILARASRDETELAINSLDALRVRSFVGINPAVPLPAAAPMLRVTVEGNNRRETLLVGQPLDPSSPPSGDREFYAQLDERAALFTVVIPGPLMSALTEAQEALRDRHVLDFDPDAVTAITLAEPNRPELTLERDPGPQAPPGGPIPARGRAAGPVGGAAGWQLVLRGSPGQGPQTRPADRDAVLRLLARLADLSAERFQSDAPQAADLENWGFNRPEREIRLAIQPPAAGYRLAAPVSPLVLQVGLAARPDNHAYARTLANASTVYLVGSDILRESPVAPRAWRERLLRDLPAGASITGLKLTDLGSGTVVLEWAPAAGGPAPSAAIQAVLAGLRTLRARDFEEDAFTEKVKVDGEERPWRYRLDATISLPSGEGRGQTSVSQLWLSERLGGLRQLAGSREFDAVFAVEQPLLDALWTLTYGARDPGPPAAAAAPAGH